VGTGNNLAPVGTGATAGLSPWANTWNWAGCPWGSSTASPVTAGGAASQW